MSLGDFLAGFFRLLIGLIEVIFTAHVVSESFRAMDHALCWLFSGRYRAHMRTLPSSRHRDEVHQLYYGFVCLTLLLAVVGVIAYFVLQMTQPSSEAPSW